MICPKCGTEYREGFNECAYCHIALVEKLEEGVDAEELFKASESGEEEQELKEISPEEFIRLARSKGLTESDIMGAIDDTSPYDPEEERRENMKPYRRASDRAEDLRSSAYTLLIIGVLGLVAVFLLYIGAIPIQFSGTGRYITTGTMFVMFLLFFIIGINSFRKIGPLTEEAEREEKKIEEIRNFFHESYTAESLDSEAMKGMDASVDAYFIRSSFMKAKLNERFMDLEPSFLEFIVDDLYSEMFEGAEKEEEAPEIEEEAPAEEEPEENDEIPEEDN